MSFSAAVKFNSQYWLSIQVGAEAELSPRVPLSSVANSFNAVNADTAGYAANIKDGAVSTAKISDGAVTGAKVAGGEVVKSINSLKDNVTLAAGSNVSITPSGSTLTISASGGGGGTVTGSGSSGQVTFWTGSSSIGGDNSMFWDNSSKRLGIGTTSPSYPVDVQSSANWVVVGQATAPSGDVWGGVFFSPNSSTGRGVYGSGNAIGVYGISPATSGTNYGVYGISYSPDGTGVRGYAQSSSGNTRGISGESVSGSGVGVYGSSNGNGTAVYAESKGGGPALQTTGGAILFNGTSGGTPASGAGTRLMWIPAKSAFRAGHVIGTDWDDANVGFFSIAMGDGTTASGIASTAMGYYTTASHNNSTAMGDGTTASGITSTAMGNGTTASGYYSTAMGNSTMASGDYSTAMGSNVSTNSHTGAFIIGDSGGDPSSPFTCKVDNQFMAVFSGGYTFWTDRAGATGVYLNSGTSGWVHMCDRNKKENFRPVNGEELLSQIRALPVTEWNYKNTDPSVKYIGPMAQDFYAAFHLGGTDSLGINSVCFDGVNMAAVQALEKRTGELREKTAELHARTLELEVVKLELADLKARLVRVEQALSAPMDFTQRVSDENAAQR